MGRADTGPGSCVPAPSGRELTPRSASSGGGGPPSGASGCGFDPAWTGGRACALGQQRHRAIWHLEPRSPASEPVFKAPGAKGPPPRVSPQPRRPHSYPPPGALGPSTRTLLSRPSSSPHRPAHLLTGSPHPSVLLAGGPETAEQALCGGPLPTAACPGEQSLPSPRS